MNKKHQLYIQTMKELLELGTYIHDDKLLIRAQKTHSQTKKMFPLSEKYWCSDYIDADGTDIYWNAESNETKHRLNMTEEELTSDDWKQRKIYKLNRRALTTFTEEEKLEILKYIRLEITGNQIDIMLSGILTAQHNMSRLRLLAKTVEALIRADIFSAKLTTNESHKTRSYQFLNEYFKLSKYEIRIDTNRKQGLKFINTCRRYTKEKYNFSSDNMAYLTSPNSHSTDYQIVVYDRYKKKPTKLDASNFPIRCELRVEGKMLKKKYNADRLGDICKGSASDIIDRFRDFVVSTITSAIRRVGAIREFDQFCSKKSPSKYSTAENLKRLIDSRSFEQQLLKLNERKKKLGEDEIDIPALLRFHGHHIQRYGYDIV